MLVEGSTLHKILRSRREVRMSLLKIAHVPPATVEPKATVLDAVSVMAREGVGAVAVLDAQKRDLRGIFTERDAVFRVLAEGQDPHTTHIGDVMTAHPQSITPDKPLGHALLMMYENGYRHVPVVENGRPIGMASARDALGPELQ